MLEMLSLKYNSNKTVIISKIKFCYNCLYFSPYKTDVYTVVQQQKNRKITLVRNLADLVLFN